MPVFQRVSKTRQPKVLGERSVGKSLSGSSGMSREMFLQAHLVESSVGSAFSAFSHQLPPPGQATQSILLKSPEHNPTCGCRKNVCLEPCRTFWILEAQRPCKVLVRHLRVGSLIERRACESTFCAQKLDYLRRMLRGVCCGLCTNLPTHQCQPECIPRNRSARALRDRAAAHGGTFVRSYHIGFSTGSGSGDGHEAPELPRAGLRVAAGVLLWL